MKLIMAYINPFKLEDVRDAVKELGASGMTVTAVEGFGRQAGHTETYRGMEYDVQFTPKIKIEVLADDSMAAGLVAAIEDASRSGALGDGKIAVIPVEDVVRIRTGERGAEAI
ncbi:MAG: P-II family nitrogen regulator [Chloroflexota bacterium]